jgi:hypothetical protein
MTQNAPVEAEIGRYYETPDYISHSDTQKGLMNRVYHWVRQFMLAQKAALVKRTSKIKKGTILDYGTGTGYFAHTMKLKGWTVKAIEKSPQARAFAQNHFGLDVYPETTLKDLEKASFDVVTLWHVMEHLEHLNEMWGKPSSDIEGEGSADCGRTQSGFIRCQEVQGMVGSIRCTPTLMAFPPFGDATIRSQAWIHSGREIADAVRCLLCIYADRKI